MTRRDRIYRSAAIDGRMVLVRGGLVVHERVVIANVPQSDDDIALDPFWPGRRGRHFTLGNAIRPVREYFQRCVSTHSTERSIHRVAAHSAVETAVPRVE